MRNCTLAARSLDASQPPHDIAHFWVALRWNRPSGGSILCSMSEVTQILSAIEQGDPKAANELLPIVYDELRKLAAAKLAGEKLPNSMQATALVHEAYLRLVGGDSGQYWNSRGHFFGAAAEAMRRILVERARANKAVKRGGDRDRVALSDIDPATEENIPELIAVHEALDVLDAHNSQATELVKLRYFAGFGQKEAAEALGISRRTADRLWAIARARLRPLIRDS